MNTQYIADGNVNGLADKEKFQVLKKVKQLPYDPIINSGIILKKVKTCLHKCLYAVVQRNTIHEGQRMETTLILRSTNELIKYDLSIWWNIIQL